MQKFLKIFKVLIRASQQGRGRGKRKIQTGRALSLHSLRSAHTQLNNRRVSFDPSIHATTSATSGLVHPFGPNNSLICHQQPARSSFATSLPSDSFDNYSSTLKLESRLASTRRRRFHKLQTPNS